MVCANCGRDLPEEAKFCLHCGTAQRGPDHDPSDAQTGDDVQWESAQIVWFSQGFFGRDYFAAEVRTPKGTHLIETPGRDTFLSAKTGPERSTVGATPAHQALVERLVRYGFEPVGVGDTWWAERFRRPAYDRAIETCEITFARGRFLADVMGPGGVSVAAETERLRGLTVRSKLANGRQAHAELVATLRGRGWREIEPWGDEWWQVRLKHRIGRDVG